jgi:hypothetical protein
MAADLVNGKVSVIMTMGGGPPSRMPKLQHLLSRLSFNQAGREPHSASRRCVDDELDGEGLS